jgi:hypothetical protein
VRFVLDAVLQKVFAKNSGSFIFIYSALETLAPFHCEAAGVSLKRIDVTFSPLNKGLKIIHGERQSLSGISYH